jgi:serine/threonine-protein kinase
MAADRDLLFGLLALQNGLIDQGRLVAAFQAWTLDKSRSLADHLVARGDLDPDQRQGVEAMVGLHLKKHDGDAGRSLAAVAAGRSTRESLAALGDPEIEHTLTHLASGSDGDAECTASYAVGSATSDGLRFRVLRPHARGGLGAVFVALDAELHREVALKQILDQHADDATSRARFLLEAEITGGLEHPGIVPVYGLGAYADGRPYYAMRFIRGDSLKEAADRFHADEALKGDPGRRSLELRKLLRRFTDVCNAIEYAHSRGVLHRDIKPGNIIVGKHGETLVVDWGLAKAVGRADPRVESGERTLVPSSASGSAETLPGSALGTPAYMSPEQAEGDLEHLGAKSDVYSLGATLYYLLTGRPPFGGEIHEILRAVRRGELAPPRQHDSTIDRALEAVCLKAMAHKQADRYASPRGLSDEVERWMADEPVSAWREPLSRRARRWAKRNRTAVATAAVAALAIVVGLSAVLVVQTRAKADIAQALGRETRANVALAAANDELGRSQAAVQARYDLAVEAIRTFHTGVTEDFLLREEKFKDLRDRLLKSASDFYGKLGALLGKETDFASRRALAAANFELAELTATVGRNADALAAHRAVLAARRALAGEAGAGASATAEVGRSLTAVAGLLESSGKTDEALATYRQAEGLLSGSATGSSEARSALAACRTRMGDLLSSTGRDAEALASYRLARADQEAAAAAAGASNEARSDLADTVNRIGHLLRETGRPGEAEAEFRRALAIRRELAQANPAVIQFRSRLAASHHNLGLLQSKTGRPGEAEAEYRRALAIHRELAQANPAVTQFRGLLADSHNNLGVLLDDMRRPGEAEAEYRRALAIHRELAEAHPAVTQFRSRLADSHNNLSVLLDETGRPGEAEAEYRRAMAIYRELAQAHPAVTNFRFGLADIHNNLGELHMRAGRPGEAEAEFLRALALYRELAEANPAVNVYRSRLALSHNNLGMLQSGTGRPGEAEAEYRRALALYRELADRDPGVPDYRNDVASGHTNFADVVRSLGRPAEARDGYDRAIALGETLVAEVPEATIYRSRLADGLRRRGLARGDLGDPAGAAADARRARGLYDGLPSRSGGEWFETACCHAALAGLAGSAGSGVSAGSGPDEADRAMEGLRRAVAIGYRNLDAFRSEAALGPLRNRDDFRALMMDLAFPADPFARRD